MYAFFVPENDERAYYGDLGSTNRAINIDLRAGCEDQGSTDLTNLKKINKIKLKSYKIKYLNNNTV